MAKNIGNPYPSPDDYYDTTSLDLDEMLYARHAEVESFKDLTVQRGTPIPTLFNNFYKFIQNPSSISIETFKRMVDTDDTIGAGTDFLTTCLAARLGSYKHPSKEITKWMNDRLEEIEGGKVNKTKEMLSASWAGFFVGEKVWANTDHGFVIERIPPLPPSTILFEVDRAGRLTEDGILQYQRNWVPFGGTGVGSGLFGLSGVSNGFLTGPNRPDPFAKVGDLPFPLRTANTFSYLSIRIPKQKCLHYSFNAQGNFDNPYGRSLLRRAYKYYVLKDAILRMYATALDRKGTPMTVVFADPNTNVKDARKNANDNILARNAGPNVGMSAMAAAAEIFKNPHNDSVFILPGKKGQIFDIEAITQDFNPEAFLGGIAMCDRSMLRALLIPALIFGSGDGSGSFSLGQEHARTFDKILDGWLSGLKFVMIQQIVREMLCYNFPRSAWEKDGLGEFTQRELTSEERQKEMEVAEKAVNLGTVDVNDLNDLNEIRQKAGFSERTEPIPQKMIDPLTGEPLAPEEDIDDDEEEDDEGDDVERPAAVTTRAPARKKKLAAPRGRITAKFSTKKTKGRKKK
jgi:hypothetical protein